MVHDTRAFRLDDSYRGKRVLVTGHTGFKGSWLTAWLLDLGAEVAGFSIDVPTKPSLFEALGLAKRIRHGVGDIRDAAALQKAFREHKPDVLFHLAAQALVRPSYDDPKTTFDTNVGGTVNVLEAVRATPSLRAAVLIASDKCYENVEWEYGYRETDPLGGKDPYSASKGCAEIVYRSYARSFLTAKGPRSASARAGNVIGGGDWALDRIVPDCMRAWSQGGEAIIRNPASVRPWQHMLEPLSGYLTLGAALLRGDAEVDGESFNFGPTHGGNQPVSALVDELRRTWPKARTRVDGATNQGKPEAGLLQLSCERAHRRLGWQPALTFSECVDLTGEWYRQYHAGGADLRAVTSAQIETYSRRARERGLGWAGA